MKRKPKIEVTPEYQKCVTKYCRNKRARNSTGRYLLQCWKCRHRQFKKRCPEAWALNNLRKSARKRNIACTLTVAQFKAWCAETGFIVGTGQNPGSITVDRIERDKGYHVWNIRPLSHAENSLQGRENKVSCADKAYADAEQIEPETSEIPAEDQPF